MPVDEVLITLHLHRAVSADVPVPIARMRVVEYIDAQVKSPVTELRVLEYGLVHGTLGELPVEFARLDEMSGIEIPLSHGPHVYQYEKADSAGRIHPAAAHESLIAGGLLRPGVGPEYQEECAQHHERGNQGVMGEQHPPVFLQCRSEFPVHSRVG